MNSLALINWWPEPALYPPLGLGYIASYLKRYGDGYKIKIFDSETSPLNSILEFKPDIVGLTSVTFNYKLILGLARELKNHLKVPVIMGGPHISNLPQLIPSCVDIVVRGEGEQTLLELLRLYQKEKGFSASGLSQISGISYRQDEEIIVNPPREFISPLDKIPPPDRNLLDMEKYLKFNFGSDTFKKGVALLTSRGCPYRCIFCQSGAYWGRPRLNSAEFIAREIVSLYNSYKMEVVSVIDDLFIINRSRIEELIGRLKSLGLLGQMEFWVDGRVDLINSSLLELLKRLNSTIVSLGLESASDRLLEYLKKDGVTSRKNLEAVELVNSFSMGVFAQVMIGVPTETEEDIKLTLEFLKEILKRDKRNSVSVSVLTPYPGTPLWDYARKNGKVSETMDWGQLEAKPHRLLKKKDNFIYLNDAIPKKRFLEIVARFQSILDYQTFMCASRRITLNNIRKAILKPHRLWQLIKGVIKARL